MGKNIGYYQNDFKRKVSPGAPAKTFYTLSFTHTFEHEKDQQYFAHCYPYTYSDLQEDLTRIQKDAYTENFFHRGAICRTLAGNRCELLTITSKEKDQVVRKSIVPTQKQANHKKGIIITARVHPGESNSSWMMKGLIEFLVSATPEAQALRDHFVFKIIPILNPDGVINGNYRCSLSG